MTESVSVGEKTYFGLATANLIAFGGCPKFQLYIPMMSFLCGVFVDLGTHHIESESLETLDISSYQSIWMRKLCLGKL